MKNKINKFLAVWICVVMIATGFFVVLQANAPNVKAESSLGETSSSEQQRSTTYVPHDPIYIDGNADFTAENGVSNPGAAGTEADPYIIEDWDINASSANGIEVRNTNAYFILRNCYVHDGRYFTFYSNHGIHFYNVQNGQIENTNSSNNRNGIYLYDSSRNNICNNSANSNSYRGIFIEHSSSNNIYNNSASSNNWNGIYLSFSSNNTLSNNIASNNYGAYNGHGIHLSSSNNNNIYNNSASNNWDDGIHLSSSNYNDIYNNSASNNDDYGICLSSSNYNDIYYNNVLSNTYGVCLYDSSSNNIYDNTASNNNYYGICLYWYSSYNTVSNNRISNNDDGIDLTHSNYNNISNNSVSNNIYGICLHSSSNNSISNNNVSNNGYGIYLRWYSNYNNNIHNNSFLGNLFSALYSRSSTNIDARYNYFGTTGQKQIEKLIDCDSGVDYSNWLSYRESNVHYINTTVVWNGTIILDKGVIVNGDLSIKNANLVFASALYQNFIQVNGHLTIANSIVRSNYGNYTILYLNGTKGSIINSDIKRQLGLSIQSEEGISIQGSNLTYGYYGMVINKGKNVMIKNCNILNNDYGIYLYYSSNNNIYSNSASKNYRGICLDHSSSNNIHNNNANSNNGDGIFLDSSSNNKVYYNTIASNNWYGIHLLYSNNNNIYDNNANSNNNCSIYLYCSNNNIIFSNSANSNNCDGIYLISSSNNAIFNNSISNNYHGIFMWGSSNNTLGDNTFENNGIFIRGDSIDHFNTHKIDITNTANGKPIYYYTNQKDIDIDGWSAGQIILANCMDFTIKNVDCSNATVGVELAYCDGCSIENSIFDNGVYAIYLYDSSSNNIYNNSANSNYYRGIFLERSSSNNIYNNSANSNSYQGIYLYHSNNNNISNNTASNNYCGIWLYSSNNNNIINNKASNNDCGFYLRYSNNNNISNNTANLNSYQGIYLYRSNNNNISNNSVSNSYQGIYLYRSINNNIFNNNINSNTRYGIYLQCSSNNNRIYHNNFIDNIYQSWCSAGVNQWDDGYPSGGNYWSDYAGIDADEDGIGDTPYNISGGGNQDRYPLMNPIGKPPAGEPGIPDLAISDKDISWDADYLIEDETVELRATVHNIGTVLATATVEFYIAVFGLEPDKLIGQNNVTVHPNETAPISIQWNVDTNPSDYSKRMILVKIVNSTPSESNINNNDAYRSISINNWGWGRINADKTLKGEHTGKGIVVAVIDSGIDYTNPDLSNNIWKNLGETGSDINGNDKRSNGIDDDDNGYVDDWRGWDFDGYIPFIYPGDNDPSPTKDFGYHATHVTGILGARAYDDYGITGVAPEAKIMNLRINFSHKQDSIEIAQAIIYAADNGADIISMSLGGWWSGPPELIIWNAVQYAYYIKGCVLVAAAGNENIPVVDFPARFHNVLAVAATDKNDQRGVWGLLEGSNYGPEIDISAPGIDIWSDFPDSKMEKLPGTSMATPFVSGVAALVLEANEKLKRHPDVVYALLKDTATPLSDKEWDLIPDSWEYGAGLVNAKNAVDHAKDSWDSFNLACPANLSVYDDQGRHVGLNATGGIDLEIPRAYYSGPEAEPETLVIFNSTGDLTIDVLGNSTGIYNLTMESYDGEGIKTFEIWDSELTNKTIDSIILKEGRNTVIIKTNEDEKTYSLNITKKTLNETDTFTINNMTIESDEYHSYDVLDWENLTTANNTVILNITETGPGAINLTIYLTNGMNGTVVEHNIKVFKIKYMMNETIDLMQTLDEMDIDQEAKDDLNNTLTGVLLHLAKALYYHTDPDLPDNVSVPQKNDTCDRHLILARFMLCEFIKQVEGYRDQGRISNEDANILIGDANTTVEQITRILEDGGPGPKPVDDSSPPIASLLNLKFFVNNTFILLIIALIGILMTAYPYYREIKIDGDFEMHRKLGELSFKYGSCKTALEHFKKAIWLNSNDAIIWNDMGVVLKNKGKYGSALKCYDNAIKLNPSYERAWYNKGCALSQIGDYYRAFDCFNKVVELNADNLDAGNMRDEVLERIINVMNN